MNKYLIVFPILAVAVAGAMATAPDSQTLMTIGDRPVSLDEFGYLYEKNASQDNRQTPLDEYVEMFVNYRLKVADALDNKLDTLSDYRQEMEKFRRELAAPYFRDKAVDDSLVRVAYDHLLENVEVSHILLPRLAKAADGSDKLLADSLYELLQQGADFADLARQYSRDPMTQAAGGRMGYIRGGQFPYAFEDVVYNTPVGQVAKPFSTVYGDHIIKVTGRRPDPGELHARHILKLTLEADSATEAAKHASADSIYQALVDGADFDSLARTLSDDRGADKNGGDLPWFGVNIMVPEFEQAAFALADGEISRPVKSRFGYHVIQRLARRDILPLDSLKTLLTNEVLSDERSNLAIEATLRKYAAANGLTDKTGREIYEDFLRTLPDREPSYRNLLNEYSDGLLLYEISNRRVWNRPTTDPEGLEKYFNDHRRDFRWDRPHFKGYLVSAENEAIADSAVAILERLRPQPKEMSAELRKRLGNNVKVERIIVGKGDNKLIDFLVFDGPNPGEDSRWKAYRLYDYSILEQPSEAIDVRGRVSVAWQNELERQWLKDLRKRYSVKINKKVLKELQAKSAN